VSLFAKSPGQTVTFGDRSYTLDAHGFLDPPEQWDERFAEGMAERLGVHTGLTGEHWSLVRYLRNKFLRDRTVPLVVFACLDNGLRLSRLRYLFPTGYHRGACRIAGIHFEFLRDANFNLTLETYTTPWAGYPLSPLGFLDDFDRWDERFAWLVGREHGLSGGLSERHRRVMAFLRVHYRNTGTIPTIYETCRTHGLGLDELAGLFPGGYRRGACRMAGLPPLP